MSGTWSAWTVGVHSWIVPISGSSSPASGKSSAFRKPSASSPMTTTSFGCTMWSSRIRKGRASSSSSSANLRQFVP